MPTRSAHHSPRPISRRLRASLVAAATVAVAGLALAALQPATTQPAPAPAPAAAPTPAPAPASASPRSGDNLHYGIKDAPAKPSGAIRLVSFNIENLFDDKDDPTISGDIDDIGETKPLDQLRGAAAAIKALNADVIALQEIESEQALRWFRDNHLQGLGYDHIATLDAGDGRGIEQSVLSRLPLANPRNWVGTELDAPRPPTDRGRPDPRAGQPMKFARSPFYVEVQVPPAPPSAPDAKPYTLALLVVHHKSGRDFNAQREAEARKVVELAKDLLAKSPDLNLAVLGDFNATPDADSVKTYLDAKWIDAFAARTPRSSGRGFENPWVTHASGRVIDYIFVSPNLAPEVIPASAFVYATPSRAPGADFRRVPAPPGYASDHMPIAIDIVPTDKPANTPANSASAPSSR
jgi:endonuclease/exonuclease/phosphatase family metal-dependent hydrolase